MIGPIISTATSLIASNKASKDAKKAQRRSLAAATAADAENYRRALESIGSSGSALLPLYFTSSPYFPGQLENMTDADLMEAARLAGINAGEIGDDLDDPLNRLTLINRIKENTGGQPFEKTIADDIMGLYGASQDPVERLNRFRELQGELAPTQASSNQFVKDIFSGQMLSDELAELQPVADARMNAVRAFEDASQQSLADTLNRQDAQFARKGYTSAGSASDRLAANARRTTAQQAAGMRSDAELKNAIAELAARGKARTRQGSNLGLPLQQLGSAAKFETSPDDLAGSALLRSTAPAMSMRRGAIPTVTKDPFQYDTNYSAGTYGALAASRMLPKVLDYAKESGLFGSKQNENPFDPNFMDGIDSPFAGSD